MMSTEPTNEELAKGYAKQIEEAQKRREAKDLDRLERHGQAAAVQSQAIEDEQQEGKGSELDANRDNEKGDQVKESRARELAERFKEKAGRDRQQERDFSR
jgi:hypothetical protein